jgi:flagellar P-ring protein FlgI
MKHFLKFSLLLLALLVATPTHAARIKDVARIDGVRPNQLIGYGLVVGLDHTGDSKRSSFTSQSLAAMLSRMGIRIDKGDLLLRNVAAVMVTATLPPFAQPGTAMDISVSSIGDAKSLVGGTLVLTPLKGLDGQVYGMGQGPIQVGGYGVQARSSRRVKNHLNVGRIPQGAIIERPVPIQLAEDGKLKLHLQIPDFATAQLLTNAVNGAAAQLGGRAGTKLAKALSSGTIEVTIPGGRTGEIPAFIADLEVLTVTPNAVAKVVINGRTGTVVVGANVHIAAVAVAHGSLTIEVNDKSDVSQPRARAAGNTAVTTASDITATEEAGALKVIKEGATLASVVDALNALGATPRDLVDILQAIKAAGALHATIEVL